MTFGARLRELRKAKNLSQRALADLAVKTQGIADTVATLHYLSVTSVVDVAGRLPIYCRMSRPALQSRDPSVTAGSA